MVASFGADGIGHQYLRLFEHLAAGLAVVESAGGEDVATEHLGAQHPAYGFIGTLCLVCGREVRKSRSRGHEIPRARRERD
jgi:hypothetical protein